MQNTLLSTEVKLNGEHLSVQMPMAEEEVRRRCQYPPSSWRYRITAFYWMGSTAVLEFGMPAVLKTGNAGLACCADDGMLYPESACFRRSLSIFARDKEVVIVCSSLVRCDL